jgi:hypothetical protein
MYDLERKVVNLDVIESRIIESIDMYINSEQFDRIKITEEMLESYRKVKFCSENSVNTLLSSIKCINNKITCDTSHDMNSIFIGVLDDAIKRLKAYPKYGKSYHEIIYEKYIRRDIYTYDQLAKKMKLSKQNIISKRNEAINVLAEIIWGSFPYDIVLNFFDLQGFFQ